MKINIAILIYSIIGLTSGLTTFAAPQSAFRTDSVDNTSTVTNLEELVVVGKNAWIESGKVVFIPTKKQKKLANSAATLITSMNLPVVNANGNEIIDYKGNRVAVYINGEEATEIDLQTFWPSDVTRVEYFSDPTDPRFKNHKAVINFITPQYEVGGITKFDALQEWPWYGLYSAASKLAYKSMTYGLALKGNFSDNITPVSADNRYSDFWLNKEFVPQLDELSTDTILSKDYEFSMAANAIYRNEKIRLTHTAGIKIRHIPHQRTYSQKLWVPSMFNSELSWQQEYYHGFSPQVNGDYLFLLNKRIIFQMTWGYSYSSVYNENFSRLSNQPLVENTTTATANSISTNVNLSYTFSDKGYIQLQIGNTTDFYVTEYSGYSPFSSHQTQGTSKIALQGSWQPSRQFYIGFLPGVSLVYRNAHVGDRLFEVTPIVSMFTQWYPVDKLFLRLSGGFVATSPYTSTTAEAFIRKSTLFWFKGNPNLKSRKELRGDLNAMYMLADWLTPSVNVFYLRSFHNSSRRYYAASESDEGIVEEYFNSDPQDLLHVGFKLSGNYLNRALTISISPTLRYQKTRDYLIGDRTLTRFYMYARAGYNIGDFGFNINYETSQKMISNAGQLTEYRPDRWGISIEYGNGNLYISASIDNLFHTTDMRQWKLDSNNYSYEQIYYQPGRTFSLNLSYTFGYGKKVPPSIQIDVPDRIKSGAGGSL